MNLPAIATRLGFVGLALLLLAASGCGSDDLLAASSRIGTHERRITALEATSKTNDDAQSELTELRIHLEAANRSLRDLTEKVEALEGHQRSAVFDPAADPQYQVVQSGVMPLAFVVQKVTPNADGVRVLLQIGNFSTAIATSGNVDVKWGARMPKETLKEDVEKYFSAWTTWEASIRKKQVEIVDPILPGRWNYLEVSLPETSPDQLGYIEFVASVSTISLTPATR